MQNCPEASRGIIVQVDPMNLAACQLAMDGNWLHYAFMTCSLALIISKQQKFAKKLLGRPDLEEAKSVVLLQ